MSDFNCYIEEIEVYESSSHEERKSPSKTPRRTYIFFLYILPLQILSTMRQKKKKSIFKLFLPQNKTTENLNLRIKETTSKILRRIRFPFPSLILWFRRRKAYLMSHRRRIGLSITNSSLNKYPSTWSPSISLESFNDCAHWKMKKMMQKLEILKS